MFHVIKLSLIIPCMWYFCTQNRLSASAWYSIGDTGGICPFAGLSSGGSGKELWDSRSSSSLQMQDLSLRSAAGFVCSHSHPWGRWCEISDQMQVAGAALGGSGTPLCTPWHPLFMGPSTWHQSTSKINLYLRVVVHQNFLNAHLFWLS